MKATSEKKKEIRRHFPWCVCADDILRDSRNSPRLINTFFIFIKEDSRKNCIPIELDIVDMGGYVHVSPTMVNFTFYLIFESWMLLSFFHFHNDKSIWIFGNTNLWTCFKKFHRRFWSNIKLICRRFTAICCK